MATTSPADRALLTIYVAIDVDDELFDTAHGRLRLGDIVRNALGREPRLHVKTAGWRHNICWLWDFLGREAVAEGDDFFVLFGDDVRLITPGWKHEV